MFFSDVLDLHRSCCPEGCHSDILGDGFLLESNPVYRQVKKFAQSIGVQFVEASPDYLLLPFHELPKIVASKKVPYVPAARLMAEVERERPGVYATEDLPMPESYHVHEAAHVIAEHFLGKVRAETQHEEILKAVLAESFANTVDALMGMAVEDETQYFFVKQNCYMHPHKSVSRAMKALSRSLGSRFAFMLIYYSYVHANFLTKPLGKKAIQDLAKRYATQNKTSAKLQKDIATVNAVGEKLDPNFRVTTTANYFKQRGFDGELEDLLDFPFHAILEAKRGFREAVEAMADSIV